MKKPKKKYNPADYQVISKDVPKFVSELTLDECRQCLCQEIDCNMAVIERVYEIQNLFCGFGYDA